MNTETSWWDTRPARAAPNALTALSIGSGIGGSIVGMQKAGVHVCVSVEPDMDRQKFRGASADYNRVETIREFAERTDTYPLPTFDIIEASLNFNPLIEDKNYDELAMPLLEIIGWEQPNYVILETLSYDHESYFHESNFYYGISEQLMDYELVGWLPLQNSVIHVFICTRTLDAVYTLQDVWDKRLANTPREQYPRGTHQSIEAKLRAAGYPAYYKPHPPRKPSAPQWHTIHKWIHESTPPRTIYHITQAIQAAEHDKLG